jgi:hypothetical protein
MLPPERRMGAAEANELAGELEQISIGRLPMALC